MKLLSANNFLNRNGISGFNKYESAILSSNNLNSDNISEILPDSDGFPLDFNDYKDSYEHLFLEDDFCEFIENNKDKKFINIGDYDCDGICSSVILLRTFKLLGLNIDVYSPDRFINGYGLSKVLVDKAIENKADVIITSDNGIVAYDAIDYAKQNNIKVIVTDHHMPKDGKNNADIIIDPIYNKQEFTGISGATVILKLCLKLLENHNISENFEDLCSLAAITVLSDVMPVIKENRILLKSFFDYANKEAYKSGSFINKLANMCGFYVPGRKNDSLECVQGSFRDFNVDNINFYLSPIINSVNRVNGNVNGIVKDILGLFDENYTVGNYYSNLNRTRKQMKDDIIDLYENSFKKETNNPVITVIIPDDKDINYSGINGLVASYIVESQEVPALVAIDDEKSDVYKFSGRSVEGFNLFAAFTEIKENNPDLKFNFGGHAIAMGLSCEKDYYTIKRLEEELGAIYAREKNKLPEKSYLIMDNPFEYEKAYMNFYPYGNSFEFPRFYYKGDVKKMDTKNRLLYFWSLHEYPVRVFDFKELLKLNKQQKNIEMILSFYLDETGKIMLKLNKAL